MSLDRALQLHTAALAILGAVFVGHGGEAVFIPVATALAAVSAVALTDVLGWLRLNRWLANLIAIVAVIWSLREFFDIASEEKLMAIANMLCYLQIVMLFQEKTARVYWQLVVLSVLQVVVGAALDVGPQFGLLLAFYAVLALSTLVLLCIYRAAQQGAISPSAAAPKKQPSWQLLLANPQIAAALPSQTELARSLTFSLLLRQVALLSAVTFLFAIVFFYATPRLSDGAWHAGKPGGGIAGFRAEARLPEGGRVHLSSNPVMRVALSRMTDRRPFMLIGEPYFHGEILTDYQPDERGSRWLPWRPLIAPEGGRRYRSGMLPMAPQTTTNLVRQDIVMEATTSTRRFAIVPTQPLWDMTLIPYGAPPPRSDAEAVLPPRQQRYSVATSAIRNQRQLHAIPNPNRLQTLWDCTVFSDEEQRALAFDQSRFPRVAQMAEEVLKQQELMNGKTLDKILALERHFHAPDLYRYSLNLDFVRDRQLDPIEDFVANHRTGHCQYFASALVLMLRSQGIPARMVVGFRGGAFNSVGQYYLVQGRHSHAWVEAWLSAEEVPDWELAGVGSEGGAWYRLDPTPGRELNIAISEDGVANRVAQAFDYVELLWRDYVLSLNSNRQEDLVYDPLTARVGILPSWVESRSLRRFQRWLRQITRELGLDFSVDRERSRPRAFDGSLALVAVGGVLLLVALAQGIRLGWRAIQQWRQAKKQRAAARPPAFYLRLERLLARLPLERRPGQTPHELASVARGQLSAQAGAAIAASVPQEVVAAYYRVRFGGYRLDNEESAAIEQALAALAPAVSQAKKR